MKQYIKLEQPLDAGRYVAMPEALAQYIRAYLGKHPHDEASPACKAMETCQVFEVVPKKAKPAPQSEDKE